jgi:LPS export ABC transporter protein LptC
MKYPLLAALLAGALVVLAFVLGRSGHAPGATVTPAGGRIDPGYVALDAALQQTGSDGKPVYALTATRIAQLPGSGDIHASQLQMHYEQPAQAAPGWTLSAREGLLPGNSTRLHLQGDVLLRGKAPGSTVVTRVDTQQLDYDTRMQQVSTGQPVRISWGRQQLEALGLAADLKQSQLQLQTKVHGRFKP